MEGQQVYVTGAGGEGMVLSGPEAAALLAQLGIELGRRTRSSSGETGRGTRQPYWSSCRCR